MCWKLRCTDSYRFHLLLLTIATDHLTKVTCAKFKGDKKLDPSILHSQLIVNYLLIHLCWKCMATVGKVAQSILEFEIDGCTRQFTRPSWLISTQGILKIQEWIMQSTLFFYSFCCPVFWPYCFFSLCVCGYCFQLFPIVS